MNEPRISLNGVPNISGNDGPAQTEQQPRRFAQRTASLGIEEKFRWEKALAVAAGIEDEEYCRKLLP